MLVVGDEDGDEEDGLFMDLEIVKRASTIVYEMEKLWWRCAPFMVRLGNAGVDGMGVSS